MTVIFKKERVEDALRAAEVRALSRGSRRNLIGTRCILCKMPFETIRTYQKRTCMLCRYESAYNKQGFLASLKGVKEWDEVKLYNHYLAKAILLENNKRRTMQATGCKVTNWATCERLVQFESYLDPLPKI